MIKKIVWQPRAIYQPGYNLGIYLDRDFAKEMIKAEIPMEKQNITNKLGYEMLKEKGHDWHHPYFFYGDTAFVIQFSLGENGVWLAVDGLYGESPLKVYKSDNIEYSSHNVDNLSQRNALMALVDLWVEYSDILKE